ncbi:MAG: helix-turn-helix transcriptional regulator [Bacteroidota bacterium]
MKGTYLGEFEEIVLLAVGILEGNAYAISIREEIKDQLNRSVSLSALHTAMHRLEEKGYLTSSLGEPTKVRGGKRKRLFTLTSTGRAALYTARDTRERMWRKLPTISIQKQ